MKTSVQLTLAAAVVAASVAAAVAAPVTAFPTANLGDAFRANVTHKWRVAGQGGGKCSFEILDGSCSFGSGGNFSYGTLYAQFRRVLPTSGNETALVSLYFPDARVRKSSARGSVNSRKKRLDELTRQGYLNDAKYVVDQLQSVQDPTETAKYTPLLGNVTISSVNGGVTSSVTRGGETMNVNGVFNYRGSVAAFPTAKPGTLTGQYKIKAVMAAAQILDAK
jgi:hypothetical protein